MTPVFVNAEVITQMFGWSRTTIWRKVKSGCFPCYRFSHNDVKYKIADVLYYVEGKKEGSFTEAA